MTTGTQEVMTVDELQLRLDGGGGGGGGTPMTTGSQEVTTVDELQLRFVEDSPGL